MEHRNDLIATQVLKIRVVSYEKWVPVGDLAANVSAPTALKPKDVILLGNKLKESENEKMLDVDIQGDEFTYPGQMALTLIARIK